ncbi:MAG: cell division protein ZipA C-terminal FtsZ-binding domain-containing protein [Steroidobacteraceae bacterium]
MVELPAGRRVEPEIPLDVPVLGPALRVEPAIDDTALETATDAPRAEPRIEPAGGSGPEPEVAAPAAMGATAEGVSAPAAGRPSLVVEWPPESERRIVNLRVLPVRVDRFPGRALRLSLTAAGFEHGRFGIFHLPGPGGRAVVSAASLTRPGILDPENMDFQRFGGLNLFAVLPGPLAPAATVDRLVDAACDIAQRLEGRVQDENGMPLDVERLDLLRRAAMGEAASAP